jgi:hypothetical protein
MERLEKSSLTEGSVTTLRSVPTTCRSKFLEPETSISGSNRRTDPLPNPVYAMIAVGMIASFLPFAPLIACEAVRRALSGDR